MTESWDDYAAGWDGNEAAIAYARKAFASLSKIVELEGLRVFDFGCGTGLLTAQMAEHAERIVAFDPSPKMVAVLKGKNLHNVDAVVEEVTERALQRRPGFVSGFDLVVASSVCAFLPDYRATLELLRRLLKSDGLFIQWDWLKSSEDQEFGFTESQVAAAFQQVGLKALSVSAPFSLESDGGEMKVVMGVGQNA
jgi:predicted TPR repeat methyltransferase